MSESTNPFPAMLAQRAAAQADLLRRFDALRKGRHHSPLSVYRCGNAGRDHALLRVWDIDGDYWAELGKYKLGPTAAESLGIARRSTPRRAVNIAEQLRLIGPAVIHGKSVQVTGQFMFAGCDHIEVILDLREVQCDAEAGGVHAVLPAEDRRVARLRADVMR